VLIVVAVFLLPVAALGQVVVGAGIGGVSLGDKMSQVRKRLGRPKRVRPPAWVFGAPLKGQVEFDHRRRVKGIWTASRRQRTQRGIGPGSSKRAVRRAYPRLHCHSTRRFDRCTLYRHSKRKTVATDFFFKGRLRILNVRLVPTPSGTPIPK
jgi:hypothetical protein